MIGEIKAFISAYAKSLGITFAEAEDKILQTGCVRTNALRKYANRVSKGQAGKAPKARKAPKAKAAPKGTSIAKKKATAKKAPKKSARKTPSVPIEVKVSEKVTGDDI